MDNAKIYLSGERGLNESALLRSYQTFNFGTYYNQHKQSFGSLYALNDDTLAPRHAVATHIDRRSYILLLPVVGCLEYTNGNGNTVLVEAGQVLIAAAAPGAVLHIRNPLAKDLVNYLQLRLSVKQDAQEANENIVLAFNLDVCKNTLTVPRVNTSGEEIRELPFAVAIGKFAGRRDLQYVAENAANGLYVFVIEGAFEVQNRLMQSRDGLALWNCHQIDAEALSNNAILLLLELPL